MDQCIAYMQVDMHDWLYLHAELGVCLTSNLLINVHDDQ